MSHTMDTDYGLPIPMHRSLVYADIYREEPLPFRRELNQTTQLTAENSTPYTLPKRLSRLESLPFEIRRIIWMFLGIKNGITHDKDITFIETHDVPWTPLRVSDEKVFRVVMCLNMNIRCEILDMLCRGLRVKIEHHLSHRKVFFNPRLPRYPGMGRIWNNDGRRGRGRWLDIHRRSLSRQCMQRMIHSCSTFTFLRNVYLGRCTIHYDEPPHSLQVCATQVRRYITRRAESIRFIADHCPLLEFLQVVVTPWPRDHRSDRETKQPIRFCEFEPVTLALKYVTQKCPKLEIVRAVTPVDPYFDPSYNFSRHSTWSLHDEIRGLSLTTTPIHLREDMIEAWVQTCLRKVIECGTLYRHVDEAEYELFGDFNYEWQKFRTTVLGQLEFEDVELLS